MMNKFLFISIGVIVNICFTNEKIVTVGGSITEIVFSLNQGHKVAAVDQSSTIPNEVATLPQVGYIRSISAEGILSLEPTKILTTSDIGPPNIVEQIKATGVELIIYDSPKSYADIIEIVKLIAKELDADEEGEGLVSEMNKSFSDIKSNISKQTKLTKMALFMGMGGGSTFSSFSAAGAGTRADYLIEFIGGKNIFRDTFTKYSKVDVETLIDMNPEVILIASMGNGESTIDGIYKDRHLKYVDAIKNRQVHFIDLGQSLTFGSNFVDSASNILAKINNKK